MVAPDDMYEPREGNQQPQARDVTFTAEDLEPEPLETHSEPESWRSVVGRRVVDVQHAIDSNLSLVRVGCVLLMAGSACAAVSLSGVLGRFNHVNDIPSQYFRQRKAIRVRMVRQSEQDPNLLYVYHTPFLRRVLLQDTLPSTTTDTPQPLLAVRAFGIQVDESAQEWVWSNLVSSHRYMTLRPMHRMNADFEGQEPQVTCTISIRKLAFDKDLAHELVSKGLAECLPENLDNYVDASGSSAATPLMQRLQQLEAAQMHAQTMQYGIWKDWQDEKLANRMLSASKRVTSRGFQKLVEKITGSH